jgi:hypothetical protein
VTRRSECLQITSARLCRPFSLRLRFNDGVRKRVNLRPLLDGPVFVPLRDPKLFARVKFDSKCGTVSWPNGADLAPEALHDLPVEPESANDTFMLAIDNSARRLPSRPAR